MLSDSSHDKWYLHDVSIVNDCFLGTSLWSNFKSTKMGKLTFFKMFKYVWKSKGEIELFKEYQLNIDFMFLKNTG